MDSEKVIKRDNAYVLHTYNRSPVVLEKGHGLYAEGPEGQKYLDFTSGIGVNSLGYCDLAWAEAVSDQAHKLQHTSNLYYTAPCGKLAKKLCKRTGQSRVFFGNSGAEANEGAIKAARKYSVDHYGKDRTTVITLVNSFQALNDYACDPLGWRKKCLVNIAKAGFFSSDRTIGEYDRDIWHLGQ